MRRFGGLIATDGVSIDLHRGQVHAVIGANGAGKSTLINLLSGEIALSSGEIWLAGQYITTLAQPRRARLGVGRSYQRTTIFPGFSVLENCCLAAQGRTRSRGRYGKRRSPAVLASTPRAPYSTHPAWQTRSTRAPAA